MKLHVQTEVDVNDMIDGLYHLEYDQVVKLILRIDAAMADVAFSEMLVKKLLESLKPDADDVSLKCVDWSKVKHKKEKAPK